MLLLAAALLPVLAVRVSLLIEQRIPPTLEDLRGFSTDLAVASLLAAVLGRVRTHRRWITPAFGTLWVAVCYANYEHVRVNDANALLFYARYLADPTFFEGSVLALSSPLLLLGLLAAVTGLVAYATRLAGVALPVRPALLAAVIGSGLPLLWPPQPGILGWRQANVVWENLSALRPREREPLPARVERPPGDLAGEPIVPLDRARTNVLLVMVEGISGGHIAPIAAANGRRAPFALPHLNRLAERGLTFTSFVSQQRQTNRGEFAILCGEYPKLRTESPKMSEYVHRGGGACLPDALAEAGYHTVYLQAAPLAFMMKDQFMARAGFQEVLGEPWFRKSYGRSKWGVDDRAYFEQSLEKVAELQANGQPWFLTLLTVGTHHPYSVPRQFRSPTGATGFTRAAEYADDAFGRFLGGLEQRGVLANTLVIVTSDESVGVGEWRQDFARLLSQSWGYLVALLPGVAPQSISTPYLQLDIPLSILDYLGLHTRSESFSGRSLFRRYAAPRPIAFGNTFQQRVGGLDVAGRLYVCGERFERCTRRNTDGQRLFAAHTNRTQDFALGELEFLRKLVAQSLITPKARRRERIPLIATPARIPLEIQSTYDQIVFGGQNLDVPAHSRIDVDVDLELRGVRGSTHVTHDLVDENAEPIVRRRLRMNVGDRLRIRYSYATNRPVNKIENRLWVNGTQGSGIELRVRQARMQITREPELAGLEEPVLEIHAFDVTRGN